jgi:hypothetical protein
MDKIDKVYDELGFELTYTENSTTTESGVENNRSLVLAIVVAVIVALIIVSRFSRRR